MPPLLIIPITLLRGGQGDGLQVDIILKLYYNSGIVADWIKEWAIPLSAGATFLLAIAAFWTFLQSHKFNDWIDKTKRIKQSTDFEGLLKSLIGNFYNVIPISSKK